MELEEADEIVRGARGPPLLLRVVADDDGLAGRPDGDGSKGEGKAYDPCAQVQGRGQGVEEPGGESTCLDCLAARNVEGGDACLGTARWEGSIRWMAVDRKSVV